MEEYSLKDLDPRLQKQAENANRAADKGNPGYAIPVCAEVLKRYPGCVEVRRILRKAQMRMVSNGTGTKRFLSKLTRVPMKLTSGSLAKKNPEKALEQAETWLAKDPENVVAHALLGEASENLGLWQTAVLAYESIRAVEPDNQVNLKKLTRAYIESKRLDEAVRLGEHLLKINPGDAEAQNLVRQASVNHSLDSGKWEEEGDYRSKLKDEETARDLEQAGRVMSDREGLDQRIARLITQVEAEPEQVGLYKEIAESFHRLDQPAEANRWIEKARETEAGRSDVSLDGLLYRYRTAELEAAIELAKGEAEMAPESLEAAEAALSAYQLEHARQQVERYPNDTEARHRLGELLLGAGALDESISHLQAAQRNPKLLGPSLLLLGKAYREKQFYDLAAEQLQAAAEKASRMDAFKKEVLYELGCCYEAMGAPEKAGEAYKALYSVDIGYRDVAEKMQQLYRQ